MDFRRLTQFSLFAALLPAGGLAEEPLVESKSLKAWIRPDGMWIAEAWRVADGGVAQEDWWNSLVHLGAEIGDEPTTEAATNRVVANAHWIINKTDRRTFADATGAFNPVSGIMASDHLRAFNLFFQHDAAHDNWSMKAGLIAADDDFMLSDYAALFANSAFGAMPAQIATPLTQTSSYGNAFAVFPVTAPGLWLRFSATTTTSLQLGVYHGGPGPDTRSNHGFRAASTSASGVAVFAEATYRQRIGARPATTRIGAVAHTGTFDDLAALQAGAATAPVRGLFNAYLVEDVVLAESSTGEPRLGAFARIGVSPQRDRSTVTAYGDAGFNWFGPIASRPADVLGAAVAVTKFGPSFRTFTGVAASETVVELTYCAQVTPAFDVQADVQWLTNPAPNARSNQRETATVIGVRTSLRF